ncbi:MerR family transcriptional regulator [Streptomyces sp. NPDC059828]|uniref:DNA polymerase III subunit beta family protein n=1 Tax=Streptomyces sp. NPDC059828 TaxID=3346965 RepID=UPI00365FC5F4
MESEMRSIGELARESGLTISALRFYDRAGVLVPAQVDPFSSYRWYGPGQLHEARLLARLRRAGMPLTDIRLVLAAWAGGDNALVRGLLEEHLRRLERGLSEARREFSTVRELIRNAESAESAESAEKAENPMTKPDTAPATAHIALSIPAAELAGALDAVRFAAGSDPALPMLAGVLFDIEGGRLRVVATDRYRMAVAVAVAHATAPGHGASSARVQAMVPSALVDAMRALLGRGDGDGGDAAATARLTVDGERITLETADRQAGGQCLGRGFPDYRRLVRLPAGRRVETDTAGLRAAVEHGPVLAGERSEDGASFDLTVLSVTADGALTVTEDCEHEHHPADRVAGRIGVNRDFLLQALAAGDRDRLVLELGGPTAPLAIRRLDNEHTYSLLMPVRIGEDAG